MKGELAVGKGLVEVMVQDIKLTHSIPKMLIPLPQNTISQMLTKNYTERQHTTSNNERPQLNAFIKLENTC